MAIIIGGHPRSGTTLLVRLLDGHPDITMTREFGNFQHLGQPWQHYTRYLQKFLKNKPLLAVIRYKSRFLSEHSAQFPQLLNRWFLFRYFLLLRLRHPEAVGAADVESVLHSLLGSGKLVGDKYPDYVFSLDTLAKEPNLQILIIYRDCRHVVESTLHMVGTKWRGKVWTESLNTPAKVAARWVKAIEAMEAHAGRVFIIRYEEFCTRPKEILSRIGQLLGVDPDPFKHDTVRPPGGPRRPPTLSTDDLQEVMDIAGPTLRRLGYE